MRAAVAIDGAVAAADAVWRRTDVRVLFAVFLLTRVWLVGGFTSLNSDVSWAYYPVVLGAFQGEGLPYRDLPFPYPPAALLAVWLPGLIRLDPFAYHLVFQAEMVLLDVVCFLLMVRFLSTGLGVRWSRVRGAMVLYSSLGFGLGNLIYDRLDMMVAAAFMGAVVLYREGASQRMSYYLVLAVGGLAKLVPMFWLPVAAASELVSGRDGAGRIRAGYRWLVWGVVPFLAVLVVVDWLTTGGLLRSLGAHGVRGIEIESLWATPFVVGRAFGVWPSVGIDVLYGSLNVSGPGVPLAVVEASKYLGFVLLGGLYVAWLAHVRRRQAPVPAELHFRALFAVLTVLIATQRVLSPQYLIWIIPGVSVHVALLNRPGWS
jgi:hypothetical protein